MKNLNFNLASNETIRKVSKIVVTEDTNMSKLYTFKMLAVLNYEGLLPAGYYTRVCNSHISYHKALLMVQNKLPLSSFHIASKEVKPLHYVIALIEKHNVIDEEKIAHLEAEEKDVKEDSFLSHI